jgi:hypothetical protein
MTNTLRRQLQQVVKKAKLNWQPSFSLERLLLEQEQLAKELGEDFVKPNKVELDLCRRVWQTCYEEKAREQNRDVTAAELEEFRQFCRQQGVEPEQLSLPLKTPYGL